jgi:hypothetical protein
VGTARASAHAAERRPGPRAQLVDLHVEAQRGNGMDESDAGKSSDVQDFAVAGAFAARADLPVPAVCASPTTPTPGTRHLRPVSGHPLGGAPGRIRFDEGVKDGVLHADVSSELDLVDAAFGDEAANESLAGLRVPRPATLPV